MRDFDTDGRLLCELQADTFELSVDMTSQSSEIFMRRFMHSQIVKSLDNTNILVTNLQPKDLLDIIEEQYGPTKYGSNKYSKNEMYWIGYLYRYLSYTRELSSTQVYRMIKPKTLKSMFLPYHSLDMAQAAERILESEDISFYAPDDERELNRQYKIFRRIRSES